MQLAVQSQVGLPLGLRFEKGIIWKATRLRLQTLPGRQDLHLYPSGAPSPK